MPSAVLRTSGYARAWPIRLGDMMAELALDGEVEDKGDADHHDADYERHAEVAIGREFVRYLRPRQQYQVNQPPRYIQDHKT